jgi:hypothetical protein
MPKNVGQETTRKEGNRGVDTRIILQWTTRIQGVRGVNK